MNKTYFRACWGMILLLLPWLAYGAGLGKLTLGSSLGQPLKAEIELVSVMEDEIPSLTARVASPEAFRQAGLIYAPYHSSLLVSVEKRINGQPYIQITSSQSINEPFVNLLIELAGSSGRLLREYTVLLDPAETQAIESAAPVIQQLTDSSQAAVTSKETVPSRSSPEQRSRVNEAAAYKQGRGTYGPVARGDTLTKIAKQVAPEGVDLNQMLVALYQANRNAFFENNMNLLKVGVILRVPEQSEISAIGQREAHQEIKAQTANWQAYRQRIADAAMASSPKAELRQSGEGKIATTIDEQSYVSKNAPSEEVLILSKGESPDSLRANENFEEGKIGTSQDYLRMMEEDAIAKERALQEANERITLLEQNIERLQRLLEIKGTAVTEAQLQAEQSHSQPELAQPLVEEESEATPPEVNEPATLLETEHAEHSETVFSAQPTMPAEGVDPVQLPGPVEVTEITLSDQMMAFVAENLEWVGGTLAVLLTVWLGISILRRRRGQNDDMEDVFDYGEISKEDKKVSPVTGQPSTASPALGEVQVSKKESFFESAEETKFNSEKTLGNLSESAAGFFFGKNINENPASEQVSNSKNHDVEFHQLKNTATEFTPDIEFDIEDANSNLSAESVAEARLPNEPETLAAKAELVSDLEFTLDFEAEQAEKKGSASNDEDVSFHLDFSGDMTASSDAAALVDGVTSSALAENEQRSLPFDLSEIKLDLDDEPEKIKEDTVQVESQNDIPWDEVAVKIDLAKAYLEMEDKKGAREILEEILQEGTEAQQATIKSMLDGVKND